MTVDAHRARVPAGGGGAPARAPRHRPQPRRLRPPVQAAPGLRPRLRFAPVILAIDQGTTGTTCIVFDEDGQPAGRAYSRVRAALPAARLGRARRRTRSGTSRGGWRSEALDDAGIDGAALAGIGITNQRETVVAWDRDTGEPLHRALVWQDRRTAARCDELREAGHEDARPRAHRARARPLLLRHEDRVADPRRRRDRPARRSGRSTAWLVFKLTGELRDRLHERVAHAAVRHPQARAGTRAVRAARRAASIAARAAPERARVRRDERVRRERAGGGHRRGPAGRALRAGVPARPGDGKNTYGTGSFVLENAGTDAPAARGGRADHGRVGRGRPRGLRARGEHLRHRRRGAVAARRARDHRAGRRDRGAGALARLERRRVLRARRSPGSGSPHWDPYARGTIVGLTRGNGRAHLARAALEAIAYQTADAVRAMEAGLGRAASRS